MTAPGSTGIDFAALIKRVLRDKDARALASHFWGIYAPTLLDERDRNPARRVRVSDAGRCALELWAELHGKFVLAENVEILDSKLLTGSLDGCRTACMIAAGIQTWHWPYTFAIEPELDCGGIRGHADLIVYAGPDAIEVVECKLSLFGKGIRPPDEDHRWWLFQACMYALGVNAPWFTIVAHAPAAWTGPERQSFRYATSDWEADTHEEYERLARAELDEKPEPDSDVPPWRHKSCRYPCALNTNPLMPTVDVLVDTIGAL